MSDNLSKLLEMRGALVDEFTALATGEGEFNQAKADELTTKIADADKQIEGVEKARATAASFAKPINGKGKEADKATTFASLGEQLQAVASAAMNKQTGGDRDPRLVWKAPSGLSEQVPSDGGFLVQTDFRTDLLNQMNQMGSVISRVTRFPISSNANGAKLPAVDETARTEGNRWGGVLGYWTDEAGSATAKKPKFRTIELSLKKLHALMYATDELLADTTLLTSLANRAFAEELTFKAEDAIVRGTGAGQPLGILNSGALISVTPESGQGATTWRTQNILDMWARLPFKSRANAVWFINQEVEPQLIPLTLGSGTAVILLYYPTGTNANPDGNYGRLLGRPVIPVEYCSANGTAGDVILADMSDYVLIEKGGVQAAESAHVKFLTDEMTFRFTMRLDGQPATRTPLTPYKGTNTLSPYVVLAGNR